MPKQIIPEDQLGKIRIFFECQNESCPDPEFPETTDVDPTFFTDSGTPICSYCGDDMAVTHAVIEQ